MGKKAEARDEGIKTVAKNRKAFHDYEVLEQVEAGLVLAGTEVKSLRGGSISIEESFARPRDGEVFLFGVHIPQYVPGTYLNHEPERARKLLLHRREIRKLEEKVNIERLTIVPLELYFKRGYAKVLLGVCRGRKARDKRAALREREAKRSIQRAGRRSDE